MLQTTRMVWLLGAAFLLVDGVAAAQSSGTWDVVVNGRSVHVNAAHEWDEDLGRDRARVRHDEPLGQGRTRQRLQGQHGESVLYGRRRHQTPFHVRSDDFYVDLGGVAFVMTRQDVNHNEPFPGVLPAATFGFKRIALNLTYMPESVVDRVTNSKKYDPSMEGVVSSFSSS